MFNLQGGGFLLGKKEEGHLFCAEMSQRVFLVFSFEYPLAPEALFPQILKDLMTGMGNAKRYFEIYDGDGEHIYMTGTSAGASLCVYLAAMLKSPELAKAFQVVQNDLKSLCQFREIIRNLPPSFLVTAYGDTLRNYSRQYAKAIKKAGVICHLEDYEVDKKLPHAFSTTFPEMEESKRANTQMVEFLFKY